MRWLRRNLDILAALCLGLLLGALLVFLLTSDAVNAWIIRG